jgi:hypothetical protein
MNQPKPEPVRPYFKDVKYVKAEFTDVTQTWKRFGWKPVEPKKE